MYSKILINTIKLKKKQSKKYCKKVRESLAGGALKFIKKFAPTALNFTVQKHFERFSFKISSFQERVFMEEFFKT